MMPVTVGTLESSDCQITLQDAETLEIQIESVVKASFGHAIEAVIFRVLEETGIRAVRVEVIDKGALDYTIEARLKTAIKQYQEVPRAQKLSVHSR